jgi:hypothetical protein
MIPFGVVWMPWMCGSKVDLVGLAQLLLALVVNLYHQVVRKVRGLFIIYFVTSLSRRQGNTYLMICCSASALSSVSRVSSVSKALVISDLKADSLDLPPMTLVPFIALQQFYDRFFNLLPNLPFWHLSRLQIET